MQRNDSVMASAVPRLDRKYASEIKGRRKTRKTNFMASAGFKVGDVQVSAEQIGQLLRGSPDNDELFYSR
jgi:hypothetical protein